MAIGANADNGHNLFHKTGRLVNGVRRVLEWKGKGIQGVGKSYLWEQTGGSENSPCKLAWDCQTPGIFTARG